MSELETITPQDALELYCDDIDGELSLNSVRARRYHLQKFVDFCEGADRSSDESRVGDCTELTGRDIARFKNWRTENLEEVTLRNNLSTLRIFLRFCVSIDGFQLALSEKLNVHDAITEYLDRFEYASLDHALFTI